MCILSGCNAKLEDMKTSLVFISKRKIQGDIIALVDNKLLPVVIQNNKLIVCKNRKLDDILVEHSFPGKYVAWHYQHSNDINFYSDFITIISNDGINTYVSCFGSNIKPEFEFSSPTKLKSENYIKFFSKQISVSKTLLVSHNVSNEPFWLFENSDLNSIVYVDMRGNIYKSISFDIPTIVSSFIDNESHKLSFFGFNGDAVLFFDLSNNWSVTRSVNTGLNVPSSDLLKVMTKYPSFLPDKFPSDEVICVNDGNEFIFINSRTKDICCREKIPGGKLGPSFKYVISNDGVYFLNYDNNNDNPDNFRIEKILSTGFRLVWFSDYLDLPYNKLVFSSMHNNYLDIAVFSIDTENIIEKNHTITDKSLSIEQLIPGRLLKNGLLPTYIYTQDSIYEFTSNPLGL
jgi:hypothetical protein